MKQGLLEKWIDLLLILVGLAFIGFETGIPFSIGYDFLCPSFLLRVITILEVVGTFVIEPVISLLLLYTVL